jgi:hypothetical protein
MKIHYYLLITVWNYFMGSKIKGLCFYNHSITILLYTQPTSAPSPACHKSLWPNAIRFYLAHLLGPSFAICPKQAFLFIIFALKTIFASARPKCHRRASGSPSGLNTLIPSNANVWTSGHMWFIAALLVLIIIPNDMCRM